MEAEQEYPEYSKKSPRPSDNKIWDFFDPDPNYKFFYIIIISKLYAYIIIQLIKINFKYKIYKIKYITIK